jgi:hypothetical protein
MSRRIPAIAVMILALVAIGVSFRTTPEDVRAVFSERLPPWMPSATFESGRIGNWVCPGVPATGEPGIGGEIIISNPGPDPVTARITWVVPATASDPTPFSEVVEVESYAVVRLNVEGRRSGVFAAAVVAVDRSDVIVEQQAFHPAGNPVSACSDVTSDEWFFAEGFTLGGSVNRIVITNPSEDLAIVDVAFATADGARVPSAYQGIPVAAKSIRVLDLGVAGGGAQGESRLAITVRASRGQVVVGRAQHQLDGGRLGYTLSLGAPAAREQWWFAGGMKGPEVTERFMVYNPTTSQVDVDVIFLGVADVAPIAPLQVPPRQVVMFDPGPMSTLGEGRHAAVFSTSAGATIVVERILTLVEGARPATSVLLGAPPRADGYVANVWRSAATPTEPTTEAFVIYNLDNIPALLNVEYVSLQGPLPVPGMTDIELGPAEILALDFTEQRALGAEIVISSTTRIFVERNYLSGFELGRSASWALPVR